MNFGSTFYKCMCVDLPCCLIGGFNEIASPNKKHGGIAPSVNRFQCHNKFLSRMKAATLPVSGNIFTWKKRMFNHLVFERLDKTIVRDD